MTMNTAKAWPFIDCFSSEQASVVTKPKLDFPKLSYENGFEVLVQLFAANSFWKVLRWKLVFFKIWETQSPCLVFPTSFYDQRVAWDIRVNTALLGPSLRLQRSVEPFLHSWESVTAYEMSPQNFAWRKELEIPTVVQNLETGKLRIHLGWYLDRGRDCSLPIFLAL